MADDPNSVAVASTARAMHAVGLDESLTASLSPPAAGMVRLVSSAIETATGKNLETLASEAITEITNEIIVNVSAMVGDVLEIVPFLGTVVKAAIAIGTLYSQLEAAKIAQQKAYGQNWLATAVVQPIDSTTITPADYFAPIYNRAIDGTALANRDPNGAIRPFQSDGIDGADSSSLPAIGYALTVLTENAEWGGPEIGTFPNDFFGIDATLRDLVTMQARQALGDPTLGIPIDRINQFKMVRQAIAKSLVVQPSPNTPDLLVSNEGAEIWPLYLDMLRIAFDEGQLTREYAIMLLNNGALPGVPPNFQGFGYNCGGTDDCLSGDLNVDMTPVVDVILDMVNKWRAAVNPKTEADKLAYQTLESDIQKAEAQIFGNAPATSSVPFSKLVKYSPEQAERAPVNFSTRAVLALNALRRQEQSLFGGGIIFKGMFK